MKPSVAIFLLAGSMALNVAFLRKAPLLALAAGALYALALWLDGRS